jgi:hypothetical protein
MKMNRNLKGLGIDIHADPVKYNLVASAISYLYESLLERSPSQAEIDGWVGSYINGGNSIEEITGEFLRSPEYAMVLARKGMAALSPAQVTAQTQIVAAQVEQNTGVASTNFNYTPYLIGGGALVAGIILIKVLKK